MPTPDASRAEQRTLLARGDRVHASHLVLCATFALWRGTQATPALSAEEGATWPASTPGRALALASTLVCIGALATAVVTTLQMKRDRSAWALLAAMTLALAWRDAVDVFDLVYAALALALGAYWFRERRAALVESVLEHAPSVPHR
ncbi:MAG: hypothetical protein HZA53_18420 [Planctomycetes bacterium]|nr:hypothetical protein [Planctomycetota bacterium]